MQSMYDAFAHRAREVSDKKGRGTRGVAFSIICARIERWAQQPPASAAIHSHAEQPAPFVFAAHQPSSAKAAPPASGCPFFEKRRARIARSISQLYQRAHALFPTREGVAALLSAMQASVPFSMSRCRYQPFAALILLFAGR